MPNCVAGRSFTIQVVSSMSQQFPPSNPYAAPNQLYGEFGASKPIRSKPGYLTFLCIVSLVLGCLGAARGGCAAVSVAGGGPPFPQRNRAEGMPPALQESFKKLEAEGQAIDARYSPINKAMIFLQAIIGLVMVAGAVMVLQSKRPGDWLLRGAYAATLLVGLVSMVPFVAQMLEMQPLLSEMSENTKQLTGPDAAAGQVIVAAMTGVMYGGICMGAVWLMIKLGILGHGIYYLGTPQVQESLN